jgi:hypothetical protein
MKTFAHMGVAVFAAAIAMASTEAYAGCFMTGGVSMMVTEDLAKSGAVAALNDAMAAHGWKPHGHVRMKCETSAIGLPKCHASQKACG